MRTLLTLLTPLLLVTASLAGCVGGTGEDLSTSNTQSCERHVTNRTRAGTVSPDQPLSLEARHEDGPNEGEITVDAQGGGSLNVVLERDGERAWSREFTGTGNMGGQFHSTQLPAGNYTLTASTDAGVFDVSLRLTLTWEKGCDGTAGPSGHLTR